MAGLNDLKNAFVVFAVVLSVFLVAGCLAGKASPSVSNNSANQTPFSTIPPKDLAKLGGVQAGDTVTVDYLGTLDDGAVFDTSIEAEAKKANFTRPTYEPITFVVGLGAVIKGFDASVRGMKAGEEKIVILNPNEAYGESNSKFVVTVNRSRIVSGNGTNDTVEVGKQLYSATGQVGRITIVTNDTVSVDFNPPLAGKRLTFHLWLRKVVKPAKA
ncbi:FKBP-type peptidyl-prolyl cis-trans isomerase [Candidatus Micrarchaeota archaeon]|nr:FKBP-type peptidyl-prolyl cis-trans isomerase [Candidatus Micrarchaeota archaeon]